MSKKYTAFIFARGGSKGVPKKNIRVVAGQPLIVHSIKCALKSKFISKVVVSTDCEKIANISTKAGAEVLIRNEDLASDTSPEILSWKHAINNYEDKLHSTFISLPATSPLRNTEDINNAIEKFNSSECDILFGISDSHRNPYLNMVKINEENYIELVNKGLTATRRQDVPDVYDVTTCVYVGETNYIKTTTSLMDGKVGYSTIPVQRSLDIDTEYDLYLADLLLKSPFEEPNL
jgi:N-acylneuraminate cytidylyltransferase